MTKLPRFTLGVERKRRLSLKRLLGRSREPDYIHVHVQHTRLYTHGYSRFSEWLVKMANQWQNGQMHGVTYVTLSFSFFLNYCLPLHHSYCPAYRIASDREWEDIDLCTSTSISGASQLSKIKLVACTYERVRVTVPVGVERKRSPSLRRPKRLLGRSSEPLM